MLHQKMRQCSLLVGLLIFIAVCLIVVIACSSLTIQVPATPSVITPIPSTPWLASTKENRSSTAAAATLPLASPTSTIVAQVTPLSPMRLTYASLRPVPIQQLLLKKENAAWILLDEQYIYWATDQDTRHILRHPLIGGKTETIFTSQYSDGDLTSLRPILSGDWLVFMDTPQSAGYTTWIVRALNLRTREEQIVTEEPGDPISWPGPNLSADGEWVLWTRTGHNKLATCDETMLMMRNLKTGEQRELDRACTQDNYLWDIPSLIGNQLIVEHDLPDSKGRGNEVYHFDLASGQRHQLNDDALGSMPQASQSWIVWKHGPRYKEGALNTVYNQLTREKRDLAVPGQEMSGDPNVFDHWLYWQPAVYQPFYVVNLDTSQIMTVTIPGKNEAFFPVYVYDNTIAWQRRLNVDQALPQDSILEWRTLQ